jgi:hypothetical protein
MGQPDLFDDPAPPYQRHSRTSKAAAAAIIPKATKLQTQVLDELKRRGSMGATDQELQKALGMLLQTELPRRVELVRAGLVKDSGRKRKTTSGRGAVVWVIA